VSYKKFLPLVNKSIAPRPFPGLYPTRIRITTLRESETDFSYTGKITPGLYSLVNRHYILRGGLLQNLKLIEFDQNGIIRTLVGCHLSVEATFANCYFPVLSGLWSGLTRSGRLFLFLNRICTKIGGHSVYVNPFWDDTEWSHRMDLFVKHCAGAKFNRRMFTRIEEDDVATWVNRKAVSREAVAGIEVVNIEPGIRDTPDPYHLEGENNQAPAQPIMPAQPTIQTGPVINVFRDIAYRELREHPWV
jgi:hypothetical protein